MPRFARATALALAALAALPVAASAQQLLRGVRVRPAVITQEDIAVTYARADGHAQSGQFAEARQAYREASALQVRVREMPDVALWQIAAAHYAEDQPERAAETLDELATTAAERAEPELRARALLEAAFLYRSAGRVQRPREIARELKVMAGGDALSAGLREEIARRIGR